MAGAQPDGPSTWLGKKLSAFLDGSDSLKSPDVTKVQALAIAQAFIAVLIVLGVDLDDNVQQAIIALSVVLGAALPLSDAAIRRHRVEYSEQLATARAKLPGGGGAAIGSADTEARRRLAIAQLELAEARKASADAR
jgi:hypothetical protein